MKLVLALFLVTIALNVTVEAKMKAPKLTRVQDNHNFNDMLINGKYQYPHEATASVEDDKLMSDLLEPRKEYKDRLQQSYLRR